MTDKSRWERNRWWLIPLLSFLLSFALVYIFRQFYWPVW